MPVPTSINDLSTTAASNSPSGSDSPATLDDHIRALASFIATLRDGAYTGSDAVKLTGSQTIAGTKTFSSAIVGSLSGNADTATTATNSTQLGGVAASSYTKNNGTSELGTTARTSGNTSAGFSGGFQARNTATGTNTGTYFNCELHGTTVGGMEAVDLGSGAAELRFSSTPAGDPNTDRRVTAGKLRSDGVWEGVGFLPTGGVGAIGTYALLRTSTADVVAGTTYAGSSLTAEGAVRSSGNAYSGSITSGPTQTGTWRCLGTAGGGGGYGTLSLYVRIS